MINLPYTRFDNSSPLRRMPSSIDVPFSIKHKPHYLTQIQCHIVAGIGRTDYIFIQF